MSFALAKGWHNVGIVLNDTAGNENNIPEKIYMHVGYFWLWIIISASVKMCIRDRYNSPFVIIPIFAFAALAILCFVIGFLLYFHKYKRTKSKSKFNKALSNILDNNTDKLVKSGRH